jgi:alkanesulfonate monooxygenase SsuD/methylene tetrahydromethanopterin reductase-like flavin-dependent oxidoreductase (luciferase family)
MAAVAEENALKAAVYGHLRYQIEPAGFGTPREVSEQIERLLSRAAGALIVTASIERERPDGTTETIEELRPGGEV